MIKQKLTSEEKLAALAKMQGGLICNMVSLTPRAALVKSRKTKVATPENLLVVYTLRQVTTRVGGDGAYQDGVNDRRLEENKSADFKSKGTYSEQLTDNGIVRKHSKNGQLYVRTFPNDCKQIGQKRYFDANGIEMSAERFKEVEAEYLDLKGENKSQGLDDPLAVNDIKIENVLRLVRGDAGFDAVPAAIKVILEVAAAVAV